MTRIKKAGLHLFRILLTSGFLFSCAVNNSQYHKRNSSESTIQAQQMTAQPIRALQDRSDGVNRIDKIFERSAISGPYKPASNYNSQNNKSSGNNTDGKQSVLSRLFETLFRFFTRQ